MALLYDDLKGINLYKTGLISRLLMFCKNILRGAK
jgi:hypothetical protein